ncbi:MAG TPA: Clp protease N-terminal domain-containing protein [Acidimicrobiales bacterium]|nr:Clp protease N-terminal domain-containing protein [Acidimicrobiales bacterium]
MFERFTDRARRVLVLAQEESRLLDHDSIGAEHIFLGLIQEGGGLAARALESLGIPLSVAREKVQRSTGRGGAVPKGPPPFTPQAKKVLELSLREALQLGHNYIGTEHMLLGLVREGQGVASEVMSDCVGDLGLVRQRVMEMLSDRTGAVETGTVETGAGETGRVAATAQPPSAGVAPPPVPQGCSHRVEDLEGALGYRRLLASADGNELALRERTPGPPPTLTVIAIYCRRCGQTVAIHPDPGPASHQL